jgi:hypothetical protein
MKVHRYQVRMQSLDDPDRAALDIVVSNHDDIFAIVDRLKRLPGIDTDDAAALGIGLKLFAEISLKYRGTPPFDTLQPAMRTFIQSLKKLIADAETQGNSKSVSSSATRVS